MPNKHQIVIGFQATLADSDHLAGALVIAFSIISMAEVTRYIRLINIFLGAWLLASPFILQGGNTAAIWNDD